MVTSLWLHHVKYTMSSLKDNKTDSFRHVLVPSMLLLIIISSTSGYHSEINIVAPPHPRLIWRPFHFFFLKTNQT
jgi:hypothetical protein